MAAPPLVVRKYGATVVKPTATYLMQTEYKRAQKCRLWRNADGAPEQQLQSTRGSGIRRVQCKKTKQSNLLYIATENA